MDSRSSRQTRNLCLDWIKKQKPVYGGEELAQNEDYTSNPLQEIETKDTVSLLRQIIDTLPENHPIRKHTC